MFIDKVTISVRAGRGGDGAVSFHREKYVAAGGPDGGDGGRGGNIIVIADDNMSTLMDFRYKRKYVAENGINGQGRRCTGKDGADITIKVPRGTLIRDKETGGIIRDMSDSQPFILAKGGRGGWGNKHFATPTRQVPRFAKPGLNGEYREVILELKLLADVGLVGFPNVGKSTLLSVVSKAHPKIANYHFTTLYPNLGVVYVSEGVSFVMADIPGIIEGASEGAGLGHDFLRHIDRCRLLIHLVDVSGSEGRDPIEDFKTINEELKNYSPDLASRPQIVVANKIDILEDPAELDAIERFVKENVQTLLGFVPEVLPVSARLALRAKQAQDSALLTKSRIEALEDYIVDRLDEKERVRLKLLNPLGVGLHLTGKYLQVVDGRMALLKDDFAVMDNITQQLAVYREDMAREFRLRLSDVDRQLQIFENRGVAFFDETMRLAHFFDLLDRPRLEAQYREQVISDIPETIEERVEEITEWLVGRNQMQWQRVMEHIRRRREVHTDQLLGEIPSTFDMDRKELIESVGLAAQAALQTYDQEGEVYRIAQSLKNAVANTALVEVGAVGLGTLIAVLASSTVLDVTGVLAASAMAVLGLFVIPSRRRRLKDELRRKIAEVRTTLMETLTTQYEAEVSRSLKEIETAISPYSHFVRSQQQRWSGTRETMSTIEKWLKRQESDIQAL